MVGSVDLSTWWGSSTDACHALLSISGDDDDYVASTENLKQDYASRNDRRRWICAARHRPDRRPCIGPPVAGGFSPVVDASTLTATALADVGSDSRPVPTYCTANRPKRASTAGKSSVRFHFSNPSLNSIGSAIHYPSHVRSILFGVRPELTTEMPIFPI